MNGMKGWGGNIHDLHSAVTKGSDVHHHVIRPYYEAVGQSSADGANNTEGFNQLRQNMDDLIAYLVAKKEKINEAEVKDDLTGLKDTASQLSSYLMSSSSYWMAEVRA